MPIHQLDLRGGAQKGGPVDDQSVAPFLRGEQSLREALHVDAEVLGAYRRQAEALYEAGKWQQTIDVLGGLIELDDARPDDALVLARCYAALGSPEAAVRCLAASELILQEVERMVQSLEETEQ